MTELADLIPRRRAPVSAVRAVVAEPPASIDDDLFVTVQSFDGSRQTWGPCQWVPSNALPVEGEECLLVLTDDDQTPWVLTTAPVVADAPPVSFAAGIGAPTSDVGGIGTVYLDVISLRVYGPKESRGWPAVAIARLLPIGGDE